MANNTTTNNNPRQEMTFKDMKNSGIATVTNVLRIAEHTTGILADKAENYRNQIAIADAIEHNALMLELQEQAKNAGLNPDDFSY